jgi:DNA-directed RNA polymerase subunit H (RpoH/RPB5)
VILVYESSVTYYAKQAIKEYNNVETFQAKRLYYNVTKHVLVPQHRVMDSEETDQFLLKHSVHLNQCPKILRTDPVVKYYGATPGELVEIKRSSPEGQAYFVYRVVE